MKQTFKVTGSAEDKAKFLEELKGMGWKPLSYSTDKSILEKRMGITNGSQQMDYLATLFDKDITYTLPADHDAALQAFKECGEPEWKIKADIGNPAKTMTWLDNVKPTPLVTIGSEVKTAEEILNNIIPSINTHFNPIMHKLIISAMEQYAAQFKSIPNKQKR